MSNTPDPGSKPKGNIRGKLPKSTLKRERIVKAAAVVFCRRGYAEATLAEIAAEAGTQAGSLYYYFDGRDQLVEEVLSYTVRDLRAKVANALEMLPPAADSLDRLITTVRTHVLTILEMDAFNLAYHKIHDQVPPELNERNKRDARSYARFWTQVFNEAVRDGHLREDLDSRLTRLLIVGSITWMNEWYKPKGASSPEDIASALIDLFFKGAARVPDDAISRYREIATA